MENKVNQISKKLHFNLSKIHNKKNVAYITVKCYVLINNKTLRCMIPTLLKNSKMRKNYLYQMKKKIHGKLLFKHVLLRKKQL